MSGARGDTGRRVVGPDAKPGDVVRRLGDLLRRELEAEGLHVETTAKDGDPVLIIGEMKVYPRRLLEGQIAEAGDPEAVDLDWLARAHRAYFRNLRRFHPSLVTRSAS